MPYLSDSAGGASRSLSVAESASSDGVGDFVKFSFEIEEVSAGVFWKEKEKEKVCYVINVICYYQLS